MHNCETSPLVVTVDLDLGLGGYRSRIEQKSTLLCAKQIPADAASKAPCKIARTCGSSLTKKSWIQINSKSISLPHMPRFLQERTCSYEVLENCFGGETRGTDMHCPAWEIGIGSCHAAARVFRSIFISIEYIVDRFSVMSFLAGLIFHNRFNMSKSVVLHVTLAGNRSTITIKRKEKTNTGEECPQSQSKKGCYGG